MGSLHKRAIKKRPEKSESAYAQNTCIKHRNNTYNRNNTHEAGERARWIGPTGGRLPLHNSAPKARLPHAITITKAVNSDETGF